MKNQKIDTVEIGLTQYMLMISALVSHANQCARSKQDTLSRIGDCPAVGEWHRQMDMADSLALELEKAVALWGLDEADIVEIKPLSNYVKQHIFTINEDEALILIDCLNTYLADLERMKGLVPFVYEESQLPVHEDKARDWLDALLGTTNRRIV